jgi:peptidoglycan hydrolase-like protein with peptidoglycan-binding domain
MSRFITLMVAVFIATTAHAASFDANVACVQSYTAALGYYPSAVDGIDGPGTQAAITKAAAVLGLKGPYLASFVCEDLANLAAQKNGDSNLLVYTDLPQDSSILKQIVSGYQAARKLLKDADVLATVYVFQRQEALVATSGMSRQWDFALAITQGTKTYFQASRTPGVYQPWPEVAAHEYFQVHHNVLAGRNFEAREDKVPVDGAAWLVEGAAELAGFLVGG